MPFQAQAFDEWTNTDTAFQVGYSILHIIDWGQTREIINNGYSESNLILGEYPSKGKINTYFAVTLIGHAAISYVLPHDYRILWQVIWIGMEARTVAWNYNAGIKLGF